MEGQCSKTTVPNGDLPSLRTFRIVGMTWSRVMVRSVRNGKERWMGKEKGDQGKTGEILVTSVTPLVKIGRQGLIATDDCSWPHSLHKEHGMNTMHSMYEAKHQVVGIWRRHPILLVSPSPKASYILTFSTFWTVLCLFQNKWNDH